MCLLMLIISLDFVRLIHLQPLKFCKNKRKTWADIASYPGLPMFFNVAREKLGRPGRSDDVIGRGYVYPSYSPTPFTTWP